MVSKSRELNGNSFTRYRLKALRVQLNGMAGNPEVSRAAEAQSVTQLAQWSQGFGQMHSAWQIAREVLANSSTPRTFWGLYRSAVLMYASKVLGSQKGGVRMSSAEWLDYWTNPSHGLDGGVLGQIASVLEATGMAGGTA